MTLRIIAVDWSGAVARAERKIWLAEVANGELVRLECGRDRAALADHLIAEASRDSELIVGIDFAFSLPSWFLEQRGLPDGPALWDLAHREGEKWLGECEPPFWGRPRRKRPQLPEHFRRTDREVPATGGIRPKSVFQIGGAGAVGTGSIWGMPVLRHLRDAGFSIWPFDAPRLPLIVEIYPRLLTGPVVKGSVEERRRYLETHYPELTSEVVFKALKSDDAFDALVSVLVMAARAAEFVPTLPMPDAHQQLEGQIWVPRAARMAAGPGADRFPKTVM